MTLEEAFYESRFEILYYSKKGDEFQTFFEKLMGVAYKEKFMPCRPWGNRGDRKNDGFLKSDKRLFQVYAPNEMSEQKATKKINEDFEGAKPYWGEHFENWTFVHNATGGLGPHIQKLILVFEENNKKICISIWGLEKLKEIFRSLSIEDKRSWFGPVPTEETKAKLGFKDLQVVLESIAGQPAVAAESVKNVPAGKLEANALSQSTASLLRQGMIKAPLIQGFFNQWHDEYLGEKIAEAFKKKYCELRGKMHPNLIFCEIQKWAGGDGLGTPEHQLAVLSVISYFFERCDIFEEPLSKNK